MALTPHIQPVSQILAIVIHTARSQERVGLDMVEGCDQVAIMIYEKKKIPVISYNCTLIIRSK